MNNSIIENNKGKNFQEEEMTSHEYQMEINKYKTLLKEEKSKTEYLMKNSSQSEPEYIVPINDQLTQEKKEELPKLMEKFMRRYMLKV